MNIKMGWKKDVYDRKDFLHKISAMAIPDRLILDQNMPDIRDQGYVGSCVGQSLAANLDSRSKTRGDYKEQFSATWIYNGARFIEGDLTEDVGCYPRDALDWLLEKGCLPESFWPYNKYNLDQSAPSSKCEIEASKIPLLAYYRIIDSVEGICDVIANGYYVSIGNPWFQKWMNPVPNWKCLWNNIPGLLPEVTESDEVVGGHETILYGYDKSEKLFYGQNSWGSWGDKGRFRMPFSAIETFKNLGGYDAHYIRRVA